MAADWLVRANTPAWLRLAGLSVHADALSALPEITSFAQVPARLCRCGFAPGFLGLGIGIEPGREFVAGFRQRLARAAIGVIDICKMRSWRSKTSARPPA